VKRLKLRKVQILFFQDWCSLSY